MGLFGLLNYEDFILNTLVKSNYARNTLIILLMYVVTGLVRFHLSIILSTLIVWNNFFDMIFPIVVTVLLSMASDTLFKYVETHRPWHESVVDYFMKNYTRKNFVRWKRIFLGCICSYILLVVMFVEINNYYIFVVTTQTIISFGICDLLEQNMPHILYNRLMDWLSRPKIIKSRHENPIIDNYQNNYLDRPFVQGYRSAAIINDYHTSEPIPDKKNIVIEKPTVVEDPITIDPEIQKTYVEAFGHPTSDYLEDSTVTEPKADFITPVKPPTPPRKRQVISIPTKPPTPPKLTKR